MKIVRDVVVAAAITVALVTSLKAASPAVSLPDPELDDPLAASSSKVSLVIAGGCFWGIEELYQHVRGVTDAVSGYSGGSAKSANYALVSMGIIGTRRVGEGHLRPVEDHLRSTAEDFLRGGARPDAERRTGT